MPDLTVSSAVDAFMQSADQAAMRTALNMNSHLLREIFPTIENNPTDSSNDIDVKAGRLWVANSTLEFLVTFPSITKRLDANWTVGTNQGGLDTGSKANATWYYMWLIHRSDTAVTDVLFSTSATSPTMPPSYDYKRRLPGAILTDSSGAIRQFKQVANRFYFVAPIADHSQSAGFSTTEALQTLSVPPNSVAMISLYAAGTIDEFQFRVFPTFISAGSSSFAYMYAGANRQGSTNIEIPVNASSQIYRDIGGFTGGVTSTFILTNGFIDTVA